MCVYVDSLCKITFFSFFTDPDLQVSRSSDSSWRDLKCHSSCRLPDRSSYIWYKNGQKIQSQTSSTYSFQSASADSISCAVEGHEDFPSPPVCEFTTLT